MRNKRTGLDQSRAPIYEALENFRRMRVVPFDVPGHKRGRGNPELTAFLGQACVGVDVNSMKPWITCAIRFLLSARRRSWRRTLLAQRTPF